MDETIQQRLFQIRLALGGGVRALPFDQLAAKMKEALGVEYDPSALSRMETGKRKIGLEDVEAFAALDPMQRGKGWLAFGEETTKAPPKKRLSDYPVDDLGEPFSLESAKSRGRKRPA